MFYVPPNSPKTVPFHHNFPPDIIKEHDPKAGWALYYSPSLGCSFIVYDLGDSWRIVPYLGKLNVSYAAQSAQHKMSLGRDSGCCGGDK